jgi:hypothetical protein
MIEGQVKDNLAQSSIIQHTESTQLPLTATLLFASPLLFSSGVWCRHPRSAGRAGAGPEEATGESF